MLIDLTRQLRVYLVADPDQTDQDLRDVCADALRGGVTAIQFRAKSLSDREAFALACDIAQQCATFNALFLVNDRIDIAIASRADGVHLGVDDLPIDVAREMLGERAVIGYSPDTDVQASHSASRGASYLGVGPVYGTNSKSDAGDAIGLDVFARRTATSSLPTIGIGGITPSNAGAVIEAGAVGVAVIGAILRADDPHEAARALSESVHRSIERP